MYRVLLFCLGAFWLNGCFFLANENDGDSDEVKGFKESLPEEADLKIRMGSGDDGEGSGTKSGYGIKAGDEICIDGDGDKVTGPLYLMTRSAIWDINGGILHIFVWLKAIVSAIPPSEETDEGYVWGPWTRDLDRITHRLVMSVINEDQGLYEFSLQGRPKNDDSDDAWVKLIEGEVVRGEEPFHGTGTLDFYFENSHILDPTLPRNGVAKASFNTESYPYEVEVRFENFYSNNNEDVLITAEYTYVKDENLSGEFTFSASVDLEEDGEIENLDVVSRWKASGSGRSDAEVTGGTLGTDFITITECWEDMYYATYLDTSIPMDDIVECGDAGTCVYDE